MSSMYIPAEDFTPLEDPSLVADYRFADRDVNHLFCRRCGVYPYHGDEDFGYRVNLGCVEGLDPLSLDVSIIDGRSL